MTTIATDGKTVAFDTLITAGGQIVGHIDKAVEIAPGIIVAGGGSHEAVQTFIEWMRMTWKSDTRVPKPKLANREGFRGILVDTNAGACWGYEEKLFPFRTQLPYTLGEGGDVAIGAMLAGKTPLEAVKIASTLYPATGGEIKFLPAPKGIPYKMTAVFDDKTVVTEGVMETGGVEIPLPRVNESLTLARLWLGEDDTHTNGQPKTSASPQPVETTSADDADQRPGTGAAGN